MMPPPSARPGCPALLDRWIGRLLGAARWLVLPVSALLFLQWPLRDAVQAGSREANDLAQWLFALYMAAAVTAATRRGTHLATDVVARRMPATLRRTLQRLAPLFTLVPWGLFMLVVAAPATWHALLQREAFPDTFNPGYFMIKVSAFVLSLLVVVQALLDLSPGRR